MGSEPGFEFLGDERFAEAVTRHGLSVVQVQALAVAAIDAKARAYCPYSNFRVGAALLTKGALPLTNVRGAPDPASAPASSRAGTGSTPPPPAPSPPPEHAHGQIIVGANIENCSYPVGTCAERAALATAVSLGHLPAASDATSDSGGGGGGEGRAGGVGKGLAAIAVSADTDEPCSPCGMCRQFIRELVPAALPVFMFARRGNWAVLTMEQLLPMSFGASDLKDGQNAPVPVPV